MKRSDMPLNCPELLQLDSFSSRLPEIRIVKLRSPLKLWMMKSQPLTTPILRASNEAIAESKLYFDDDPLVKPLCEVGGSTRVLYGIQLGSLAITVCDLKIFNPTLERVEFKPSKVVQNIRTTAPILIRSSICTSNVIKDMPNFENLEVVDSQNRPLVLSAEQ